MKDILLVENTTCWSCQGCPPLRNYYPHSFQFQTPGDKVEKDLRYLISDCRVCDVLLCRLLYEEGERNN